MVNVTWNIQIYKTIGKSSLPLHGVHQIAYYNWTVQEWSIDGCKLISIDNTDNLEGQCNHLTDFSILFVRYFLIF